MPSLWLIRWKPTDESPARAASCCSRGAGSPLRRQENHIAAVGELRGEAVAPARESATRRQEARLWLYTVARKVLADHRRREGRRQARKLAQARSATAPPQR